MHPSLTERARTWIAVLVVVCGLTAHLLLSRQGWNVPGLLGHGFRQAQTALTIETLRQDGFRLDYETPVLGKPWSIPMEFPLYQWLAAELSRWTDWPTVQAGRTVSLAAFYLGLPALWLLLRSLGASRGRTGLLLLPVLATPVYVFYSRAVLIESLAWATAAWFLACAWRWHRAGGAGWLVGAWGAGAMAALVKGTTWAVFLVPLAIGLLAEAWRAGGGALLRRLTVACGRGLLLVGPPLVVGLWWVAHADRVKAENPLATFLTSGRLALFNFGTLAERFDPAFWRSIGEHWMRTSMPWWALLAGAVGFVATVPRWRRAALAALGGFLAGPLVFANLYQIHDYYHYATAGFLAVAAGMVWLGVTERGGWWRWPGWAGLAVVLAGQGLAYRINYEGMQTQEFAGADALALTIRQLTFPEDVLVVHGSDWSSELAFYARRRTLMIPEGQLATAPEAVAANIRALHDEHVALVVFRGWSRLQRELVERRVRDFALWPRPVLQVDGDTDVYVAESDYLRVFWQLHVDTMPSGVLVRPQEWTVAGSPAEQPLGAARFAGALHDLKPTPVRGIMPFGYHLLNDGGHRIFMAHVPTTLWFEPPPKARAVQLAYRVFAEAFDNGDFGGVRFQVELRPPTGEPLMLLDDWIGADTPEAERGLRERTLPLPAEACGEIVFRTLPGPDGNGAFGWALLERFEVR